MPDPAIPGALNVGSLNGNELVGIGIVSPRAAQTTTGLIAGLNAAIGTAYYVNGSTGSDSNAGSRGAPFATVQAGLDAGTGLGDVVYVAPGDYDENLVIPRPTAGSRCLTIIAPQGQVGIAPSSGSALVNDADDVTIINIGLAALGTDKALVNTGSRLKLYNCKLENDDATGECAQMTLNTVAQHAASPRLKGNGADCLFSGCEFAWAASGIELVCTDYGAVTELQVVGCWFHDMNTKHIYETVGSGGSAAVMYASLKLQGNVHQTNEAGTAPTDYVLLNGNNANSGIMTGCYYPQAANGGKVLTSTKLVQVGNFSTAGVQAAAFS